MSKRVSKFYSNHKYIGFVLNTDKVQTLGIEPRSFTCKSLTPTASQPRLDKSKHIKLYRRNQNTYVTQ